ncbi:hypothetical protein ACNKHT_23545 [Shigella flexneri]
MFSLDMFDVRIMAQTLVKRSDSFSLLAIPFFVLVNRECWRLVKTHC